MIKQDEEKEEWRIVPQNNNYEVSNLGRVRNKKKKRILKKRVHLSGYETIGLMTRSKQKIFSVHRLVAQAFILNPNNFPYVNHKDRNKTNNRVTNLEWVNNSMNVKHFIDTGRNTYKRAVRQYDLQNNFIKEFDSIKEAAKAVKCTSESISTCASGKIKTCRGFVWKYTKKIKEKAREDIPWKEIQGYPGYRIYNNGQIYSEKINRYLILRVVNGYHKIHLYRNNTQKNYYIHILVAKYFCDNSDNKLFVNHKDGDKLNNNYTNLEWVTHSENSKHSHNLGLNKKVRRVHQYTMKDKYLRSFNSCREASKFLGLNKNNSHISEACRSILKSAYGYKWKYGKTVYNYLQGV
jgi:hypothetical protein